MKGDKEEKDDAHNGDDESKQERIISVSMLDVMQIKEPHARS